VLLAVEIILWTLSLASQATSMATGDQQPPHREPHPPKHFPLEPPPDFAVPEKFGRFLDVFKKQPAAKRDD
jgi:hypothetical protein